MPRLRKLTIKEKIQCYEHAFIILKNERALGKNHGMCPDLADKAEELLNESIYMSDLEHLLPEFNEHKKVDANEIEVWWEENDYQSRADVLTEIINKLKNQL